MKTKLEIDKGIGEALRFLEEFIIDAERVRVVQVSKVVSAVAVLRKVFYARGTE